VIGSYAALLLPSANRVYADAALHLVQAELEVFSVRLLAGRITGISAETIAGVAYITFDGVELSDRDLSLLGNVPAIYALYQRESDRLRPIELRSLDRLDSDLLTIMKYPGKINEQFTRLLLNVTLASSRFGADTLDRRFSVLDPLCGRGTTLNQALMCGSTSTALTRMRAMLMRMQRSCNAGSRTKDSSTEASMGLYDATARLLRDDSRRRLR